jgi:hypothetical protein
LHTLLGHPPILPVEVSAPPLGSLSVAAEQRYEERLRVPWWLWVPGLGAAALFAAQLHLGAPGVRAWLPYAVLLPAAAAGLWWLGRIRVAVRGGELWVDDAHLPVRYVADAIALDAAGRREILGPSADPLAFVVQRPWVPGAVQVVLADPADPTPYWVVSSRDPDRLASALLAAARHHHPG